MDAMPGFRLIQLSIALFLGLSCRAQTNPLAGDPQAAETGRWTFRIFCAPCHGIHAEGGRGPDLTTGVYSAGDQDQDLYGVIARGVMGSEMPGFSDRINADGMWRLVSYIRSVARHETETVEGDAAAGGKAFWDKGCGQCHRVGSKGSGIGPDLTKVGRQRSLKYIRSSILTPGADITPGYGTVKVVLPGGKTISGVERSIDNFSVQLVDLSGKYHSFVREDVTSMGREPRSLMPSYDQVLTPAELNNLLAYLLSLRGSR